ncbi:hypothetical protein Hanom_Chr01g00085861 [Helianthus anomalus]
MGRCIGVEYMRFRATCKRCHVAAPLIQWSDKTALRRLHNYSVVSPWLMVVDKNRKIITFTDPMFGDKYFMKRSIYDERIRCSRFGWLLYFTDHSTLIFASFLTARGIWAACVSLRLLLPLIAWLLGLRTEVMDIFAYTLLLGNNLGLGSVWCPSWSFLFSNILPRRSLCSMWQR